MLVKLLAYVSALALLSGVFIAFPVETSFSDYKDYLSILLTVSSMVFTLMGIWIAFLYPNALKRIVDPDTVETADFSSALSETKRLEGLVLSVLKSGMVVAFVMLVYLARMIFVGSDIYIKYAVQIQAFGVSLAIVLTFVQLESVIHVVYSNVMFLNDLHSKREDREADYDI